MMNATDIYKSFSGKMKDFVDGENYKKCIQCGICGGSCPFGMVTDYTPRRMITATRADIVSDVVMSNAPWLCSSCNACTSRCPSKIPITDALIPVLRELSLTYGAPPTELTQTLTNIQRFGNSFGESEKKRIKWVSELKSAVKIVKKDEYVKYLFIPDDFGAYDLRGKEITKSIVKIFQFLKTDFGIIGEKERTIGDNVRLSGEFGLYEEIAQSNINILRNYKFGDVVTIDPHAFHALNNQYKQYGWGSTVIHHTQFLEQNLEELKKHFHSLNYKVTYHDSCYLGRKNGIFEAPRNVIDAIPGIKRVEMPRNKENSFCCGGGGAVIWIDSYIKKYIKTRPSEERVKEAYSTGAEILVTACPIDAIMFEDAIKMTGLEGKLKVKDVAELVWESLGVGD